MTDAPRCQHGWTSCSVCVMPRTPDENIAEHQALAAGSTAGKEAAVAARAAKAPNLTCFVTEFPLALAAVAAIHDHGRGPLVKGDYRPSLLRHEFGFGEHPDHEAAVAWNALARLEMRERARLGGTERTPK